MRKVLPALLAFLVLVAPALAATSTEKVVTFDILAKFLAAWTALSGLMVALPLLLYSPALGLATLLGAAIGAVVTYFLAKIILNFVART